WVISNADLIQTLDHLVGPENLEHDYLAKVKRLRPTSPCFMMHIGLKDFPTESLQKAHGYYWESWNAEEVARNGLIFKIFVPTLYDPELAPSGGHIVIIQKIIEMDYNKIDDWDVHRAEIEEYIMKNLEYIIPGLSEKVVVQLSATALTSHKYTLNYQGAMLGWEMSPDQLGKIRVDVNSPIKNLLFVGHWVQPGGGITPVMVSALKGAGIITSTDYLSNQ
ncbi:MAG: NAD(P)/FAD-dependent oxidoreductase, partial [Gammaproteobacteria bacterium]|nr:NAD(P)/FAD-dependent oxidoreductase [Gammaproteobacteria bacterium]